MASVRKKIWPKEFDEVVSGKKNFELRLADFDIKEGDTLVLEEWDNEKHEYTGRKVEKNVKFVKKFKELPYWAKDQIEKHGIQIIALE